jgi:homocysteine S-methyltransferase
VQRGDGLVLDGATGSELQRRGVTVSRGAVADWSGAWSATALDEAPEVVQAIHEDYLRVGADIVTANTFSTNRGRLAAVGMADRMEELTRLAMQLACRARDRRAPGAYVAGSFSRTVPSSASSVRGDLVREWTEQVSVMADAGADLILIESISTIAHVLAAVEAASQARLPILVAVRTGESGATSAGETMSEMVQALEVEGRVVTGILIGCASPTATTRSVRDLRSAFSGPIGAYANIGYHAGQRFGQKPGAEYYELNTGEHTPERYAEYAREWQSLGAQIIGGCCGSTPEHIAAVRRVIIGNGAAG